VPLTLRGLALPLAVLAVAPGVAATFGGNDDAADRSPIRSTVPYAGPAPIVGGHSRELGVTFATGNFNVREGETGTIVVWLTRAMNDDDPLEVSVDWVVETVFAEAGRDYVQPPPGTLTFVKGGARFATFQVQTLDDKKHEGTERLILRFANPVGVTPRLAVQSAVSIIDDEPYDPSLLEDFEGYPYLWNPSDDVLLDNPEIAVDDPRALPGQGDFEGVLEATVPQHVDIEIRGRTCNSGNGVTPVVLWTTDTFDAATVDHATVTLGEAHETHVDRKTGTPRRHVEDVDGDGDMDLVFHFELDETGLPCDAESMPFNGRTYDGRAVTGGGSDAGFRRDFALGKDWTAHPAHPPTRSTGRTRSVTARSTASPAGATRSGSTTRTARTTSPPTVSATSSSPRGKPTARWAATTARASTPRQG
jgi:hypothetical protein